VVGINAGIADSITDRIVSRFFALVDARRNFMWRSKGCFRPAPSTGNGRAKPR
jgi:hypothetical protein